jgi:hypothetical protein
VTSNGSARNDGAGSQAEAILVAVKHLSLRHETKRWFES